MKKNFQIQKKKLNFLLNNNNINFGIEQSSHEEELFRNNFELEKKHTQILQRKKKEKIINERLWKFN